MPPDRTHEAEPLSECGSLLPLSLRGGFGLVGSANGSLVTTPPQMCGTGALAGHCAGPARRAPAEASQDNGVALSCLLV